jgi:hypothetical protein
MTSVAIVCQCMRARTHFEHVDIKECMCDAGYGWEEKTLSMRGSVGICLLSSPGSVVGVAMVTCRFLSLSRVAIAEP